MKTLFKALIALMLLVFTIPALACDSSGFTMDGIVDLGGGQWQINFTVCFATGVPGTDGVGDSYGFVINISGASILSVNPTNLDNTATGADDQIIAGVVDNTNAPAAATATWGDPTTPTVPPFVDMDLAGNPPVQDCYVVNIIVDQFPSAWRGSGPELNSCPDVAGDPLYGDTFTLPCNAFAGNTVTAGPLTVCGTNTFNVETTGSVDANGADPCIAWGFWVESDPNNVYGLGTGPFPPPTGGPPNGDANHVGFDFTDTGENVNLPGDNTGVTYYVVPITLDDCTNNTIDLNCFDVGDPVLVYNVPEITFATAINCDNQALQTIVVDIALAGGDPDVNGTSFTITNNGDGTPSTTTVAAGGVFSVTGIPNGGTLNITVTDAAGCSIDIIIGPLDGTVLCTGCSAEAGTVTSTQTGTGATQANNGSGAQGPFVLCFNDALDFVSNDDYTLPPVSSNFGCGIIWHCVPGMSYTVFNQAPTTGDLSDPGYTGVFFVNGGSAATPTVTEDWGQVNDGGNLVNIMGNCFGVPITNQSLWLMPIVVDGVYDAVPDLDALPATQGGDGVGDGCFDLGAAIEVVFLEPINVLPQFTCVGLQLDVFGGYPEIFGGLYDIVNTGNGTLSDATVVANGTIFITDLNDGDAWSVDITDANGCTQSFNGVYNYPDITPIPPTFTNIDGNNYCTNDTPENLTANPLPIDIQLDAYYTITINFDQWASENTWVIEDASNNVVASGGPYNNVTEGGMIVNFPVGPLNGADGPFTFTISDAAFDGQNGCVGGPAYAGGPNQIQGTFSVSDNITGAVMQGPTGNWGSASSLALGSPPIVDVMGTYAGSGIIDNGDGTAVFDPLLAGPGIHDITYTFSHDGVCDYVSAIQTVTVLPTPIVDPVPAVIECDQYDLDDVPLTGTLIAISDTTYHAEGAPGQAGAQLGSTIVNTTGNYYIVLTAGTPPNNCSDTLQVPVTINITPDLTQPNPVSACDDYDITNVVPADNNVSGGTITYYDDGGGTPGTQLTFPGTTTVTTTGTYYIVSLTGSPPNQCGDTTTVDITVVPEPNVTSPGSVNACGAYTLPPVSGTNISANAAYYTGANGGGTQYLPGDMITASTALFIYDPSILNSSACSDQEFIAINITPGPVLSSPPDTAACPIVDLAGLSIPNSGAAASYNYYDDGGGNPGAQLTGAATSVSTAGVYYIIGTSGSCMDTTTVNILAGPCCQVPSNFINN